MFQLQRLVLRQEDLIASIKPEMCFVIFARVDVGASVIPAIYSAQASWRELKENNPDAIKAPMRVDLLRCLFKELKSRLTALTQDAEQQQNLVSVGWMTAEPVKWRYIRWDSESGRHKADETKDPSHLGRSWPPLKPSSLWCKKAGVVSRFHPSRPVEQEMKGKASPSLCSWP